jgi:hypothetical protein
VRAFLPSIAMPLHKPDEVQSTAIRGPRISCFTIDQRQDGLYRRWDGVAASAATGLVEVQMHALRGRRSFAASCDWSVDAMLATPDAPPVAFTAWRYSSERPDAGSRSARFVAGARQWRGVRLAFREMDGDTGHTAVSAVGAGRQRQSSGGRLLAAAASGGSAARYLGPVEACVDRGISAALAFRGTRLGGAACRAATR